MTLEERIERAARRLFTKHWQREPDSRDIALGSLDSYRVIARDVLTTDITEIIGIVHPLYEMASHFRGPVIEMSEPHPENPSQTIQPFMRQRLITLAEIWS